MKWVKANERIPNDDGNRPVKVNGQYAHGNFFDLDEEKRAFSVNSSCDGYIVYPEYFNVLEWLDESTPCKDELRKEIERLKGLRAISFIDACNNWRNKNDRETIPASAFLEIANDAINNL